ncbi:unnamed protein product [Urochloa decumbens]|uniref:DUF1618 domain-containing protein n=1 Tax=Urochloa decumbens TaxID=240449 RepID=A0ABC9AEQ6_9POAL
MDDPVHRRSLHPPTYADGDLAESSRPNWVLLDFRAYFADRRNATNASCKTRNGKDAIQVTFFPAHRPRLSYFCVHVHCHGADPSRRLVWEPPKVIATGGSFILLRVSTGRCYATVCSSLINEYYVYRAGGSSGEAPSLELLPHPCPYDFFDGQVGLLSRGTEYTIAALRDDSSIRASFEPGQYEISLFHSEHKVWTTMDVSVPPEQQQQHCSIEKEGFWHKTSKAITVGGEHGTMAFVDLWNGILLYDVFRGDPKLRYVPMPQQLYPSRRPNSCSSITRDIAIVKDSIKVVQVLMKPGSGKASHSPSDGWVAATWSRLANFPQEDSWSQDFKLEDSDINGDNNPMHFELLKRLPADNEALSLDRFCIGHPMISLDDNDIVHFTITVENKAWVIAIDMRYRMLQGVAEFGSERTFGITATYTQSRISEHLNMSPGTEGNLKRPGMQLLGSCSKKLFRISSVGNVEVEAADNVEVTAAADMI